MSNPATETFGQARQGSVAAIILVLNERLADVGIRTRAVVDNGILQLLCEAPSTDQLEKTAVVNRVRQILETISPHHISRVNINSRLVKEEQLLWLEEINRDPENALLWSEMITLKRPFFVKRWIRDRDLKPAGPIFKDITAPQPKQISLKNKAIGGAGLVLLLLGTGWLFREDLSQIREVNPTDATTAQNETGTTADSLPPLPAGETSQGTTPQATIESTDPTENSGDRAADTTLPNTPTTNAEGTQPTPEAATAAESPTPDAATPPTNAQANSTTTSAESATAGSTTEAPPVNSGQTTDAFAEAVRIANNAANDGQSASTAAQWLDLAARWQRASDLMSQIPEGSDQHTQATERVQSYANNSKAALAQAAALQ